MIKCSEALGKIIERRERYFTPDERETVNVAHGKLILLEEMEKQGRLVILPCKVGDTVFAVEGRSVYKARVESMTFRDDGLWIDGTFNHFGMVYFSGEIGRNIFLTREEAEAALKGETEDV